MRKAAGLDTSVVLRLLVGEPESQAKRAADLMNRLHEQGRKAIVSDLVLAETYHALQYHYEVPKAEAKAAMLDFLKSGRVLTEEESNALVCLEESTNGAGFVDRLIHSRYLDSTSEIVSFDKKMLKLDRCSSP
ncbi:MAG: PIN domain-containing protein [Planctomycetes bacterium]|nr:PIN domain-containing protein [Planctomycetota bacterium]